jgi:hypothetical protein
MSNKQTKNKLTPLPCPFCGEMPKLEPQDPDSDGDAWARVYCDNKKCPAQPSVEDGQMVSDERGTGAYMDCAIRRWNKRGLNYKSRKKP